MKWRIAKRYIFESVGAHWPGAKVESPSREEIAQVIAQLRRLRAAFAGLPHACPDCSGTGVRDDSTAAAFDAATAAGVFPEVPELDCVRCRTTGDLRLSKTYEAGL